MRYTQEGLSNQVLAAEYRTVLPDVALLTAALEQTQQELEQRKLKSVNTEAEDD